MPQREPWPERETLDGPPRGSRPVDLVAQFMWYLARSTTDTGVAIRTVAIFTSFCLCLTGVVGMVGYVAHLLANDDLDLPGILRWTGTIFGSGLGVIGTAAVYQRSARRRAVARAAAAINARGGGKKQRKPRRKDGRKKGKGGRARRAKV